MQLFTKTVSCGENLFQGKKLNPWKKFCADFKKIGSSTAAAVVTWRFTSCHTLAFLFL